MLSDSAFTVFIVDDDSGVIRALSRLLKSRGYETESFTSSREFLEQHDAALPGCAVLDLSMPDLNGLELQQALTREGAVPRPIIFLTGRGDIPTSVQAMKAGAVDFLAKPFNDVELLAAVQAAIDRDALMRRQRADREEVARKLATLTLREREVLEHVVAGQLNKHIAASLGTVEKTIKVHRGRIMQKMGAASLVELVRMADMAGIPPAPPSDL